MAFKHANAASIIMNSRLRISHQLSAVNILPQAPGEKGIFKEGKPIRRGKSERFCCFNKNRRPSASGAKSTITIRILGFGLRVWAVGAPIPMQILKLTYIEL